MEKAIPVGIDPQTGRNLSIVPLITISQDALTMRPRLEAINEDLLTSLGEDGCSWEEIGRLIGVDEGTLRLVYPQFTAVIEAGRAQGKRSLRRRQWQLTMQDDDLKAATTAAIWLGKQYLGQSDRMDSRSLSLSVQVDGGERSLSLASGDRTGRVAALLRATFQPEEIEAHASTLLLSDPSEEGQATQPATSSLGLQMPQEAQPSSGAGNPPASGANPSGDSPRNEAAQPGNKSSKRKKTEGGSRSAPVRSAKTEGDKVCQSGDNNCQLPPESVS